MQFTHCVPIMKKNRPFWRKITPLKLISRRNIAQICSKGSNLRLEHEKKKKINDQLPILAHFCSFLAHCGAVTHHTTCYAPASKKSVEKGLFLDIRRRRASSTFVKGVFFPLYRHLGVLFRKVGFDPFRHSEQGAGVKFERIIINTFPILYVYLMFNPLSCASSHWYSTHSEWVGPFRVHASQPAP